MNLTSIISTSATAVVLVGVLGRWANKAFRWCQNLAASVKIVEGRSKQLVPNAGSSMRDEVAEMKGVLAAQNAVLAEQSATLAAQNVEIATLKARPSLRSRRW